jgi:hypothetical protein
MIEAGTARWGVRTPQRSVPTINLVLCWLLFAQREDPLRIFHTRVAAIPRLVVEGEMTDALWPSL